MTQHQDPGQKMTEAARDLRDTAASEARNTAEDVKDTFADEAAREARAFDRAANEFGADSYAHQAAGQISDALSHAANAVRNADIGELQRDMTDFARRHPMMFFGGAAVLGFLAGRALKASDRAESGTTPHPNDYSTPAAADPVPYRWSDPR